MQNAPQTVSGDSTPAQPSPQLQAVPGYQTTSGQFTAIFTLVAMILGLVGYHYSPAQIESWVQLVETFLTTLGPIIAVVPVLMTYINSRGRIASNTLNANAAIMAPLYQDPAQFTSGGVLGTPTPLFDNGWKDPHRYETILEIAKALQVPGAAQADHINQQLHPADIIAGIFHMLKHKPA